MAAIQSATNKRILVVEDSFPARESMSLILGGVGYRVSTASNGEEALKRLHTYERPDLILLDLLMPTMDGWAFREELNRDPAFASIPVVILSGTDPAAPRPPSAEGTHFLHKPVDTAELLRTVRECCG